VKDKDGFAIPSLPFAPPVVAQKSAETKSKPMEVTQPKEVKSVDQYKKFSDQTVFISNLSYDVDESKLQAIFEKVPGFQEIRLIRGWNGKTKGYGYVDFDSAVSLNFSFGLFERHCL
jgi:RNA recognition motif-containing protein